MLQLQCLRLLVKLLFVQLLELGGGGCVLICVDGYSLCQGTSKIEN